MRPDLVLIGHMAKDIQPDGSFLPGGTVTYAALIAHHLGLQVGVVTSVAPEDIVFLQATIPMAQFAIWPSESSTTFENVYDRDQRRQRLLSRAQDIPPQAIPADWLDASLTLFGPIANEIPVATVAAIRSQWRMATPQGWLRTWDSTGIVSPRIWTQAHEYLDYLSSLVLSAEDLANYTLAEIWQVLDDWSRQIPYIALTDGPRGATIWSSQHSHMHVPALPAREIDPTGAGDSFAIGFLFDLWRNGGDANHAARFAHAIAAFVIESPGITGIPSYETILHRMA